MSNCISPLLVYDNQTPEPNDDLTGFREFTVLPTGPRLPVLFSRNQTFSFKLTEGNELFILPNTMMIRSVVQVVDAEGREFRDERSFGICDAPGLMMFKRFELVSKGKICDAYETAGLASYILARTNLPNTYLSEMYRFQVGFFGEDSVAKMPEILEQSETCQHRRALLQASQKMELLSPICLNWLQNSRVIPSKAGLSLNVTLQDSSHLLLSKEDSPKIQLKLLSMELLYRAVTIADETRAKLLRPLSSPGGSLTAPIIATEMLVFNVPAGVKLVKLPAFQAVGLRKMHTALISEDGFHSSLQANPTYFPHQNLEAIDVISGDGQVYSRSFDIGEGRTKLLQAYKQNREAWNTAAYAGIGAVIRFYRWTATTFINSFDTSRGGCLANCLEMSPSASPTASTSWSIQLTFSKPMETAHKLLVVLERDASVKILPDCSLDVIE